ncbi:MAG TPA: SMP-30/gluconolactonase/LRE family protein [Verrucomicrobiae bacterium]|jgi:gluconolactonase|nr:SMP-30/gluconolactonase/LRE family protein [Verrucomicrobiae bacterium]
MREKIAVLFFTLGILLTSPALSAQSSGQIIRLDSALDALISPNTQIEKVGDGFGFLEGPVWVHASSPGFLIFSDIPANVIDKWNPQDGKVSVFLEKSGFAGADPGDAGYQLNNGHAVVTLYGSNGITLDKEGRVTYCQHGDRTVMRLEKDGKRTVLADRYEGKRLNSPNDLVYKSDGSLYFTDPPYGLRKLAEDPKKELPFSGVYRWANGKLTLVNKDFGAPNGLAFSPDEKYLYLDDSASKTYWRFDVQSDGALANKTLLIDASSSKEAGVPDGMKIDRNGNIYAAGPGGVWVLTPDGTHLGTIRPPENPANLAWGDADAKTLYFTAVTGLYRLRVNVAGIRP